MTLRWRTTGVWGTGELADLPPAHIDENFYTLHVRVQFLEDLPPPAAGIDYFVIEGDQLTVVMEDYTTRGPYTLPVVTLNFRDAWAASTVYSAGDIITHGSTIYVVNVNHTSEATFDPGLAIGGEDVYGFGLTVSGQLPTGGAVGQWLQKVGAADFQVAWVDAPLPDGGTTGQFLRKASNADQDTAWSDFSLSEAADVSDNAPDHGAVLRWDDAGEEWVPQQEYPPLIVSTSTLTLGNSHIQKFNIMTSATGCVITVPLASSITRLATGHMMHFRQGTNGGLTFEAALGVTLSGINGFFDATELRGAVATLYYAGSDTWYLYGLLASGAPLDEEYAT